VGIFFYGWPYCGDFCTLPTATVLKVLRLFLPLECPECDNSLLFSGASFFPLLYTISFHLFPLTDLPSSLTSSCHLFLALSLSLTVSKLMYNTFLGILFSSILCACLNQRYIFNLIVSCCNGVCNHCINFFIGRFLGI